MARSLLLQALEYDMDLLPYFHQKAIDSMRVVLSAYGIVKELLQFALDNSTISYYIVIDGLDECEESERKMILSWIQPLDMRQRTADSSEARSVKVYIFVGSTEGQTSKRNFRRLSRKGCTKRAFGKVLSFILTKEKTRSVTSLDSPMRNWQPL